MIDATKPKARATSGNSISPTLWAALNTTGFATAKRDLQRLVEARARRAGTPDIGAHGHVHADDARHARAEGAEQERQGGGECQRSGGGLVRMWLAEERVQHVDQDAQSDAQRADG